MSKYLDVKHRPRTFSLFYETNITDMEPVFTLKDNDHAGYPSLKRLYLEYRDPTEYRFAIEVLGSLHHWERLLKYVLKNRIKQWREELEVAIRSDAIANITQEAKQSKGFAAAKWLAEKGWSEEALSKRGRPSKEEVERQLKIETKMQDKLIEFSKAAGLHDPEGTN